ncbi:MAG TPA: amidase [Holophagaceae bacterium]|nr:amidase [Holophagaceae bacterium]
MTLDRRSFLGASLAAGAAAALKAAPAAGSAFRVEEATFADLQGAMASGRASSVSLVKAYEARVRALDSRLHSVLELNPDASQIATELDAERKAGKLRGPLHGLPVLLKDNIDTADRMHTTAGSWALYDAPAPKQDAFVAARLREAGAVILGKANLSEWANFRSTHSISGWTGRGGLTRNPYVLDRNCSGSSSGSGAAVSANLCAAAVGSETDGSIVSPSSICGIVGLKPTLGLLSRAGIIPIAHSQDTAGPMTRTVRDAALMLSAMAGVDADDAATAEAKGHISTDYAMGLEAGALKGARLGIVKNYMGQHAGLDTVMASSFATLKRLGAELVEVELPTGYENDELTVLLYEFKTDLAAYFRKRGGAVKDLSDLIAFDIAHKDKEMRFFAQEIVEQANAKGPLTDEAYQKARANCLRLTRAEGMDKVMDAGKLDALIGPTGMPAWITDPVFGEYTGFSASTPAAVAGYPHLTVPAGFVSALPVSLSFMGRAWSEAKLIGYGYAFEQATKARRVPRFLSTLPVRM